MANYYDITKQIHDFFITNPMCNYVTKGSLDELMNAKHDMYPLAHVQINNATIQGHSLTYNISVSVMDLLDYSKEQPADRYIGNSNVDDVLNASLLLLNKFHESCIRGDMWDNDYHIEDSTGSIEFFEERFIDNVAGCTMTFDLVTPNTMTKC